MQINTLNSINIVDTQIHTNNLIKHLVERKKLIFYNFLLNH